MKDVPVSKELAGIKLEAISPQILSQMSQSHEYSELSCFEQDLIPFLWARS